MNRILMILFFLTLPVYGADVKEFVLAPPQGTQWSVSPSLTLEPESGRVLAVWQKHPGTHQGRTIWGRLISPAGKPSGASFPIVKNDNTFYPQVVYNPFTKEFLLVYSRDRGDLHLEIYAQRLNLRGRKVGSVVRLSSDSDLNLSVQNDRPFVAVDPDDGGYFVTWQRAGLLNVPASGEGMIAAHFDKDFHATGTPVLLYPLKRSGSIVAGPYVTDVKFHQNGSVLIAFDWRNVNGTVITATYATMTVDATAIAPGPLKILKSTPSKFFGGSSLLIGPGDRSFIFFSDTKALKRRPIGSNAQPSGAISPAFAVPARIARISDPNPVIFDDDTAVLSGVEHPQDTTLPNNIWLQMLTQFGKPSGAAQRLKTAPTVNELSSLAMPVFNGERTLLLVYSDGQTFGVASGLILLKVTL